jgi:transcriptional regulator GlxA family with amidase domain
MIDVTVLLLNDNYASTAIGPIEVFHSAGLLWHQLRGEPGAPRFRVTIASLDGEGVGTPYALWLAPQVAIRDVKTADLVIVPSSGLDFDEQFAKHAALFPWLREKATQGALIAGVCTGAAYLAEAGLLDSREATSHWSVVDAFRQRYPRVDWHPERLITEDRRMLCSGGVNSSFDLSLYLVEKFCGHEVALHTAKALLINMPRASQSGYAVLPLSRSHGDDKIRKAEAYLERHYQRDVSIEQLAQHAHMSPRNFIRRFKAATGRLPGNYLKAVRVGIAKEMLEGGARSVQTVSSAVGYEDPAFFREVFKRCTGMTPTEYRHAFAGAARLPANSAGARGFLRLPASANGNRPLRPSGGDAQHEARGLGGRGRG